MVKYLNILLFAVTFQLIGCEPGISKDFMIRTSVPEKVTLFDKEAGAYLARLGFELVELKDPMYPQRKLYKKHLLIGDGSYIIQAVQLTYGDGLLPKVTVGDWVATDLSPSSEELFMKLKDMADKHGILLASSR